MTRDSDVRRVAAALEDRMDELAEVVAALAALLLPPEANPEMERVIT